MAGGPRAGLFTAERQQVRVGQPQPLLPPEGLQVGCASAPTAARSLADYRAQSTAPHQPVPLCWDREGTGAWRH